MSFLIQPSIQKAHLFVVFFFELTLYALVLNELKLFLLLLCRIVIPECNLWLLCETGMCRLLTSRWTECIQTIVAKMRARCEMGSLAYEFCFLFLLQMLEVTLIKYHFLNFFFWKETWKKSRLLVWNCGCTICIAYVVFSIRRHFILKVQEVHDLVEHSQRA